MQLLHGQWRLRELQFRKHAGWRPLGHWRCEVRQVRGPALRRVRQRCLSVYLAGWLAVWLAGWLAGSLGSHLFVAQSENRLPCVAPHTHHCCCCVQSRCIAARHPPPAAMRCLTAAWRLRCHCSDQLPIGSPMIRRCSPTTGRCKSCFSFWNAAAYYSDIGIMDNEDWPIYQAADGQCRKVGR